MSSTGPTWKWIALLAFILYVTGCDQDIGPYYDLSRKDIDRVRRDLSVIGEALNAYRSSHGHYPPSPHLDDADSTVTMRGNLSDSVVLTKYNRLPDEILDALPRRSRGSNVYDRQFGRRDTRQYFYYSSGGFFLLSSVGPDLANDCAAILNCPDKTSRFGELVAQYSYDPTNGLASRGDIILYEMKE